MTAPDSSSRPLVWIFVAMLAIALWSWSLSWNEPILDRHEFRQTQTAISAYWIKEAGWKLNYETPIFGPPWSIPFEFPVYQFCVAQVSRISGLSIDSAGRAVSIFYLLLTLPAVYLLAGVFGLTRPQRLLVLAAVLSSPVYLFYGRTVMIETCALCFSIWFLVGIGFAARDSNLRWSLLAAFAGALAALAKVTTFAAFCLPAGALALWLAWARLFGRQRSGAHWLSTGLLCSAPVLLAVLTGTWWVRHGDAVKKTNPFSATLTSDQLSPWTWGSLSQRFSADIWIELWRNISQFVLNESAIVLLLVGATLVTMRIRRFTASAALAFLTAPLLFINLYFHHDYYYAAIALFLLVGAGFLLVAVWETFTKTTATRYLIVGGFFGSQLTAFYTGYGAYHRRDLPRPPAIAEAIRASVPTDGIVLIYGWDWNTLVPYYAQRRAIMVPSGRERELEALEYILSQLPPDAITSMLIRNLGTPEFIANRTARFSLSAYPVVSTPDGDLYLRTDFVSQALTHLALLPQDSLVLNRQPTASPEAEILTESDPTTLDLPFFTSRPTRIFSQFGVTATNIDDQSVLLTHPSAKLYFSLPASASQIRILAGISTAAYSPDDRSPTDGIVIELTEIAPNGNRRILTRREIDPVKRPGDRGLQEIVYHDPQGLSGELEIRLTPGLMGNLNKDWAYLAGVRIE
jgi:hypothetical protein